MNVRAASAPIPVTPNLPRPGRPAAPSLAATPGRGYLDPGVAARRLEAGRVAEYTTGTPDPDVAKAGPPSYFRTFEQVKSAMHDLQRAYPDLVEVVDIGDSSEKVRGVADNDVLALRLTNKKAQGDKASAFFIGGEHAREIANPELLMRFAEQTLKGYGTDPEATALLDTRIIDIVPVMNPDGHIVVEKGYADKSGGALWHRKNTSPPAGTDLNRNYEYHWGGPGASSNPRSDTYRGPSAASEPEVRAVQDHARKTNPGIFMDWHSYSRLNLYPWGDTHDKAPDFKGLDAIARKFSTWNDYTPQQSIKLYPTSGTSKDFMYGTLGIPGFTIETGDSFHQSDREFEQTWAENAPVLNYAAKIADAPYERVKGPDTLDVAVAASAPGIAPGMARITAQVSDTDNGSQAIRAAELVLDPATPAGKGIPLAAADGAFNGTQELVRGELPLHQAGGRRLVYVRAQDAAGNWGPMTAQWIRQDGAGRAASTGAGEAPLAPA